METQAVDTVTIPKLEVVRPTLKIAVLTHWAAISPFYECSFAVVEELTKLGHQTFILAPAITEQNPGIVNQRDGDGVLRFDHETTGQQLVDQLIAWGIDVLLVHSECAGDIQRLNYVVKNLQAIHKRAYLFIHSEAFDRKLEYQAYTALLYPNRTFNKYPSGGVRIAYVDQGVPELDFPNSPQELRRGLSLPTHEAEDPKDVGYLLTTFAGKTPIEPILQALHYINEYKLTDKPVHLFVQVGLDRDFDRYQQLVETSDYLHVSLGYLPPETLAQLFNAADGTILLYPDIQQRQTSSALRFAVGARAAIITNKGRHCEDIQDVVATWVTEINPTAIKHAIVTHFSLGKLKRTNAQHFTKQAVERIGWSVVTKQLEDLLLNRKPSGQLTGI